MAGGPWSLPRVNRFVEEVGGALLAAHAAGIVHHDVRLANILLDEQGASYLADFGIALTGGLDNPVDDLRALAECVHELVVGSTASRKSHAGPRRTSLTPIPGGPPGLDRVLRRAHDGSYRSVAEFIVSWRAATGAREGALSDVSSDAHRTIDSARRKEALTLAQVAGSNPYCGLRAFDESQARSFFGREAATADLLTQVDQLRLVTIVGSSGSGKSSLARAGVVPALRARGQITAVMTPGPRPSEALEAALLEVAGSAEGDLLASLSAEGLVLVVDQLEELWTRCDEDERTAFLSRLEPELARAPGPGGLRVLATVRADLFDRPLSEPILSALIGPGTYPLPALTAAELDDAVRRPAQQAGVYIEDVVATSLVVETAGRPGLLPLLQFTLAELFDARVEGRISEESLTDLGSLTGALGRRAEQVFGALEPDARTTARALFSRLVMTGDGQPDTRRRARISELPAGAEPVVDAFVEARLLVTDREPTTREPTVELAHEALLERWDRLVAWIDDDRDWLVLLQHLSNAARAWDSSGRAAADLYRGSRLELALEVVDSADRGLSPLEHDYLRASRDERDAVRRDEVRRSSRTRRLLAATTAALVLALVAGVVARSQWRQADAAARAEAASTRAARVEALAGRAERLRLTHRDAAALLAVEAFRLADTPATRSALLATFTASQGYLDSRVLPGPAEQPHTGVVLPDGGTTFVTDEVGLLRRYDLNTGSFGDALSPMRDGLDPIGLYSASADGSSLAVIQAGQEERSTTYFTVYDVSTGQPRFAPVVHRGEHAAAIALSPDGERVYASYFDGDVLAQDATTGARLARAALAPGDAPGPIGGLALVGDRLAVGGSDSVRVLDARTLRQTADISVPDGTTLALFAAGGETVVGNGEQGTIRVDLHTGRLLWHVAGPVCLGALVSTPTDSFFCGDAAGRLHEFDLTTGSPRRTLAAQNGTVQALWLAAGGSELVAISSDRPVVSRWRIDGGDAITRTVLPGWSLMALNADGTEGVVARTPPEAILLTDASDLRVVDLTTGQTLRKLPGIVRAGWTDGDLLVGLRLDHGRGHVVDLTNRGSGTAYTFPPGRPEDPPEYRIRPQGGLRQLDPGKRDYFAVTFLPEGNEALPMRGATVSGRPMTAPDYTSTTSSPDGSRFVQGTFSGVRVYDAASGDLLKTLDPSLGVVAYITRGGHLVTSNLAGEMRVFDLDTLDLIRTLPGGSGYIPVVMSPVDDSFLATLGANRELALTDLASGLPIGTPIQLAETEVKQAGLSLDGTVLAYGGGPDSPIKVMNLHPESWVAAACSLAGRNLTAQEWADAVGELAPYRATCPQFTSAD
ncbi:MAG: PQQ-binding-like beta-propeller repeat protein [Nocardioides sp.]